ncbi:hypothetical protein EOM57_00990 [Candidatus Saccharibacteria bacterium]|nr:hypothetical protein [Candidatus Saccharibacteria bacterium]
MTKEEIKFYKEQQQKVEEGYRFKIKTLQGEVEARDNCIQSLTDENESLREQIALLQSGLTGEEVDYLESR